MFKGVRDDPLRPHRCRSGKGKETRTVLFVVLFAVLFAVLFVVVTDGEIVQDPPTTTTNVASKV